MPWARNDSDKLRNGVYKVDDLRYKEKHHRLAEMSKDANYAKDDSGKVCERVSDEHVARIPVMEQEAERGRNERQHEEHGEEVVVAEGPIQLNQVMN